MADESLTVLVVCDDDDTLIRLRDYLTHAGVEARATRRLSDAWGEHPSGAVVLMPDDFDTAEVTEGLSRLLSRLPAPLVIVVTAGPRLFEALVQSLGAPDSVVVMPKPVWGWTILEVLRNRPRMPA